MLVSHPTINKGPPILQLTSSFVLLMDTQQPLGTFGFFFLFGTKAQNQVPLLHLKSHSFLLLWPQILFLLHEERPAGPMLFF